MVEAHDDHEEGQMVEAVGTAEAVLLSQDDWGLSDSWSGEYDGIHEDCAVAAGVEVVVDALTCIEVIQPMSWSN